MVVIVIFQNLNDSCFSFFVWSLDGINQRSNPNEGDLDKLLRGSNVWEVKAES